MSLAGMMLARRVRKAAREQGDPALLQFGSHPKPAAMREASAATGLQFLCTGLRTVLNGATDDACWVLAIGSNAQSCFSGVCGYFRFLCEQEGDEGVTEQFKAGARKLRDDIRESSGVEVTDDLLL